MVLVCLLCKIGDSGLLALCSSYGGFQPTQRCIQHVLQLLLLTCTKSRPIHPKPEELYITLPFALT